ncbi:MAG: hypothetical protein RR085_12645 [Clostridia bacterium]
MIFEKKGISFLWLGFFAVVDFHDKRPLFITALIDMIAAAAGLVAGIFVRDALKLRSEKQQLEFEVNLMETQVAEQKKHHQLAVLRSYGEGSNSQQITDYIDTLIAQIPTEQGSFCENTAVNAIVSHTA